MNDSGPQNSTGKAPHAKEAGWYDDFYKMGPLNLAVWYRFLLPDLLRELTAESRLLELGCGQGQVLRLLTQQSPIREENIFGVDQSRVAIDFAQNLLPQAHLSTQDIYHLDLPRNHFDVCLLMEVIEHLEAPIPGLQQIHLVMKPGGILYVSFPNFMNLPWLPVRILAEKLNRPNWVVLQPVDKIYTTYHVEKLAKQVGFRLEKGIGSGYGPPILYRYEQDWMTKGLNAFGLWRFAFHPILKFRRI